MFSSRLWLPVGMAVAGSVVLAGFTVRGQTSPPRAQAYLNFSSVRAVDLPKAGPVKLVTASGVVKPALHVSVGTPISGTVVEVLADFNDTVRRGQPIARLEFNAYAAAVREAEAALAVAKATAQLRATAVVRAEARFAAAEFERGKTDAQRLAVRAEFERQTRDLERKRKLAKSGNLTRRDLDNSRTAKEIFAAKLKEADSARRADSAAVSTAQAEIGMAQADHQKAQAVVVQRAAALERARIDLERTTIRAPIDGVVLNRSVEVGQTVAASLNAPTLFTVAGDLHKMTVHARVDESDVGRIRVGQAVEFTVDAHPDRTYDGIVQQVHKTPVVVQNVVTYTIVISADNRDVSLLPGMTTLVSIGGDGDTRRGRAVF